MLHNNNNNVHQCCVIACWSSNQYEITEVVADARFLVVQVVQWDQCVHLRVCLSVLIWAISMSISLTELSINRRINRVQHSDLGTIVTYEQ